MIESTATPPSNHLVTRISGTLCLLLTVFISMGCCAKHYYKFKVERVFRQECFPGQSPRGAHALHRATFGDSFNQATHDLLRSQTRDRWGNYPVRFAAIDYMNSYATDGYELECIATGAFSERVKRKAFMQYLRLLCHDAEFRLGEEKERIVLGSRQTKLLMAYATSTNHDDATARAQALRILGATGRAEAVPVLLDSMKATPSRVKNAAFQGVISIAQIKPFGSQEEIRRVLVHLLESGPDDLRIRIMDSLPELSHHNGVWIDSTVVLPLLTHANPALVSRAQRFLIARDDKRALAPMLKLAASPYPIARRFSASYLETTRHVTATDVETLAKDSQLELRAIALKVAIRRPDMRRAVLPILENDSDKDIAMVARLYLDQFRSDLKTFHTANQVKEDLFQRVFDPPTVRPPQVRLSPDEVRAAVAAGLKKQQACIAKAQSLFPIPTQVNSRTEIYQFLVDTVMDRHKHGIIVVPDAAGKGGLTVGGLTMPIVSQEELTTLREDHGYDGPSFELTEIYLDPKADEAWVQLGVRFGQRGGRGQGLILKKKNGIWRLIPAGQSVPTRHAEDGPSATRG